MFVKDALICEQAIWFILSDYPDGISEYDLIQTLQSNPYHCLEVSDLGEPLQLFQTHFALFHLLYRLRNHWLALQKGLIHIVSTQIKLLPYESVHEAIQINDPLAEYYLNWNNFDSTSRRDVEIMLDDFWYTFNQFEQQQSLYSDERLKQANEILGVSSTETFAKIKKRYRKLMHDHHPDKGGELNHCQQIEQAYRLLKSYYFHLNSG